MTALNSPIPIYKSDMQRGSRVDDFFDRLSNPARTETSGPFTALILSLISFGLLPLLIWPTRWAEYLDTERRDLLDLIAWWRRRVDSDDAARLDKIARRLRPRPMLTVLPWLMAGFNSILIASLFLQGDSLNRIANLTFKHALPSQVQVFNGGHWVMATPLEMHLYQVWIASLCAAYFCLWFAVRSHSKSVDSLVIWTNHLARENGIVQIKIPALKTGAGPGWVIVAIILCSLHAWWAIPMALAGAAQRRYSTRSSSAIRIALAGQARDGFAIVQNSGGLFCNSDHCGARLPSSANYCPRCGSAVS